MDIEGEGRSASGCGGQADGSSHQVGQLPADGKSKPGAAELPGNRAISLHEPLKELVHLYGGNTDAGIGHRDDEGGAFPVVAGAHRDGSLIRELHGIAHEIAENLLQSAPVREDVVGRSVLDLDFQCEPLGLGVQREEVHHFPEKVREVHRPGIQLDLSGFKLGEIENVVDH